MKKEMFFTLLAATLLGLYSNGYASDLKSLEENNEKLGSRVPNITKVNNMNDQKIAPSCRSPYIPVEREFVGYDKERDVALFRERSNEPFMQRFWNVFGSQPTK